jgi:hypothetical protein
MSQALGASSEGTVDAPSPTDSSTVLPPGQGEDDALILWFLSLTLSERLAVAQGFVDSVAVLKNGLRASVTLPMGAVLPNRVVSPAGNNVELAGESEPETKASPLLYT